MSGSTYSNAGQKLWKKAKHLIPGGNMLLSKRPEMFLPEKWPSYFSKAHGCHVWDLDGNQFTDMCIMGIGTNILGYNNHAVDESVRLTIERGNMSTFNCPEEVYLAEKLIDLHKWSDMARFARTGGEANAIAIRIARAASSRDKIAICGYHGWHDWYLSTNLNSSDNLNEHLLPGLQPNGVPKNLKDTVFPFRYNNIEELEDIVNTHKLAAIKMEVERNVPPIDNFLGKVREICDKNNIILIFDECTSGFRETFGGLHLKYGVNPDIAIFGKALGNGYPITCIIGKRDIMESVQNTFISSTFWTDRIGPTAALATLKEMESLESWKVITETGNFLKKSWDKIATNNNIKITNQGIPALASFKFNSEDNLILKTFITQEMLKENFLATTTVYSSIAQTQKVVDEYLEKMNKIFEKISYIKTSGQQVVDYLDGPVCHSGFQRLN